MKPYIPQILPLKELNWVRFIKLIGQANAELARYDGILQGILNPVVLLSPLTTKEAVISSKIEGTQASLQEVLEFEAAPDQANEKYHDIREIINYREAMHHAVKWLEHKPLTLNLIKETHSILLDSVRGRDRSRGNFRSGQNYIGKPGASIEEATYVPPEPRLLPEFLDNFEKYIHFDEKDLLVQLALVHAQFEIIHPFLDGNGRVGRILIPLFLFEKKILQLPMFYISEYLEARREEYYARLKAITAENKWDDWVEFFLKALLEQSRANSMKAKGILELYDMKKARITDATHSQYCIKTLDTLFKKPIFTSPDFIKLSGIPKASAMRLIQLLRKEGIIVTLRKGKGRRAEIFEFKKLMSIIK